MLWTYDRLTKAGYDRGQAHADEAIDKQRKTMLFVNQWRFNDNKCVTYGDRTINIQRLAEYSIEMSGYHERAGW